MSTPKPKPGITALVVAALFIALVATIVVLAAKQLVTVQLAVLLFVALIGMYVGFGVLIAVYRFVGKLE